MDDDGGWLLSDYEPHLRALRRTINKARAAVDELYGRDAIDELDDDDLPETADELERFGLPVPEHANERKAWTEVGKRARREEVERRRRAREPLSAVFEIAALSGFAGFGRDFESLSALVNAPHVDIGGPTGDDYRARIAEVAALDKELDVLRDALDDVKRPRRLWQGFWILALFAAAGIVYPMAWMATGPAAWSAIAAISVVSLFSLGLVALLVYIALFVKDLGKDHPE